MRQFPTRAKDTVTSLRFSFFGEGVGYTSCRKFFLTPKPPTTNVDITLAHFLSKRSLPIRPSCISNFVRFTLAFLTKMQLRTSKLEKRFSALARRGSIHRSLRNCKVTWKLALKGFTIIVLFNSWVIDDADWERATKQPVPVDHPNPQMPLSFRADLVLSCANSFSPILEL